MRAAERASGLGAGELSSGRKTRALVQVKEAMILVGRELGASNADLARLLGLDASVVSRRYELGSARMNESEEARLILKRLREKLRGHE